MVFEENLLRLTLTVRFQKKRVLQKGECCYPFSSVNKS